MMRELEFINTINKTLTNNKFLGDDCANIENLNICVTHDCLIEHVHFDLKTITPFLLGYKSIAVNFSDLASCLSIPKYVTIGICAPNYIDQDFMEQFYKGVDYILNQYGATVISGDITSSKSDLVISVCAIGQKLINFVPSRGMAQPGQVVAISYDKNTLVGASALGLRLLSKNHNLKDKIETNPFVRAHLRPIPQVENSKELAKFLSILKSFDKFAMMDTSDGLVDAMFKICLQSNVNMTVDLQKISHLSELELQSDFDKLLLFGAEDYGLLFTIDSSIFSKLDKSRFIQIGKVVESNYFSNGIKIQVTNSGRLAYSISEKEFENGTFDHFGINNRRDM